MYFFISPLAQGLAKRFRFKIAIKKRRFKLFGEFNPWVLLADGSVEWDKSRNPAGSTTTYKGDDVFVLGGTKSKPNELIKSLQDTPNKRLYEALMDAGHNQEGLLKSLQNLPRKGDMIDPQKIDELIDLLHNSKGLVAKNLSEQKDMFAYIRALRDQRGIKKYTNADDTLTNFHHTQKQQPVTGGTIAVGKTDMDDVILTGSSTKAQIPKGGDPTKAAHHSRYKYPGKGRGANASSNHAEQTVLGRAADGYLAKFQSTIDPKTINNPKIPKPTVKGEVSLHVDQAVCSACRQGFKGGNNSAAGIIKQFSEEFPNVKVVITAPDTGDILIFKNGILLQQ